MRIDPPTTPPPSIKPLRHLRYSDLRGIVQLTTLATVNVTQITEGVHRAVWNSMGVRGKNGPGQTHGITGLVYKSVQGISRLVGKSMDLALSGLEPVIQSSMEAEAETPQRGAVVAALNGVVGDHLVATNNPLAIPMQLRYRDEVLEWQSTPKLPGATGKVLVLLHGLCMDDLQRHAQYQGHATDHGKTLAAALDYSPVYARYNSGLHTSENGRALSAQLEQLVDHWPVPIDDVTIVGHSMGGLIARSAHFYAQKQALRWPGLLKNLVFLGTPHHGALLERVGNWVDTILESTPYTAPFARLGRLRSAGITDLRFGYLLDDDWQGRDRFHLVPDNSLIVPLPENVACFAIAAARASPQSTVANRLLGDGLVPLPSALGRHPDPERTLRFGPESQWTAYKTNHMALLYSSAVADKLLEWLAPPFP